MQYLNFFVNKKNTIIVNEIAKVAISIRVRDGIKSDLRLRPKNKLSIKNNIKNLSKFERLLLIFILDNIIPIAIMENTPEN